MNSVILEAKNIHKSYAQGTGDLEILKGIDFKISMGEAVAIVGPSGAGKSTLLHILGTLDKPNKGSLHFLDKDLIAMNDDELAYFRNKEMGFVFQFHHLISELTALENVMIPSRIGNEPYKFSKNKAEALLETLGLKERINHYPSELSGGELQRTAIARALICRPRVLFADEPTGNLDSQNSQRIQDLFFKLKESFNLSLVVVTHDMNFASRFPKTFQIKDGQWSG